ncbi:MAG: DEAD/DEAH box helicase family protein, partial [Lachnospiraceae bacterium]|nr:DEAD/DEAH box helicase family protein [Lachnospiraceae bacterium]
MTADTYLKDKKIHIVAAPGSGKTTLGIELIARLGTPCLILSPSITIKEQWASRIENAFLDKNEKIDDWVSNTIKSPKAITTITYQALHSAYQKLNENITKTDVIESDETSDDTSISAEKEEKEDFSQFHLFQTIKEAEIEVLCLDEAHHLRSEWWKALEELVKEFPNFTIISLTATPPYDSTPAQWQKYTKLCGAIDEEIFTPELVKDKSLCPHQDYVYFNYPTEDELIALDEFKEKSAACLETILQNKAFTEAIANHKGLQMEKEYTCFFLEHPDYFYSILIFLQAQGVPLSPSIKGLIGKNGTLPELNSTFMEHLLQGFLYDDIDSYENSDALREELLTYLKANHCIVKKKVTFVSNDSLQKMLISSKGKLNSILTIANSEFVSLGKNLRQLILCDYIKREFINNIGKEDVTINETGVIPIFELLRREQISGLKLGVLCGTIIIIPESATGALDYLLVDNDATAKYQPLGETGYVQVQMSGKNSLIVHLITQLFEQGEMQILIGTKSLLGEGWDSPCINSLILASFVGSFMLSNQMRGRAIRMFKNDPDKISNIWHLLCVEPGEISTKGNLTAGYASSGVTKAVADTSPDYEMLKRRFESFLGVSYTENVIENGLQRLSI